MSDDGFQRLSDSDVVRRVGRDAFVLLTVLERLAIASGVVAIGDRELGRASTIAAYRVPGLGRALECAALVSIERSNGRCTRYRPLRDLEVLSGRSPVAVEPRTSMTSMEVERGTSMTSMPCHGGSRAP